MNVTQLIENPGFLLEISESERLELESALRRLRLYQSPDVIDNHSLVKMTIAMLADYNPDCLSDSDIMESLSILASRFSSSQEAP